jgi:RHS repeat-associated protein
VWCPGGLAHTVDGAGALEAYHADGLGSVRALTDASGNVVQTYQTDEFGIPTLTQGASGQPFRFTGEPRDAETALVYLRARHYHPAPGRFLQRDPFAGFAGDPLSLNRHACVQNNPITWVDPSGLARSRALISGPPPLGPRPGEGLLGYASRAAGEA